MKSTLQSMRPHLSLTRWLLVAALCAGCPGPTPDLDAGDATDGDTVDFEIPGGGCETDDDCVASEGQTIPTCYALTCLAGQCALAIAEDGSPCDDAWGCTKDDVCTAGVCEGVYGCDDLNPCTTDGCNGVGECVHTANGKPCDDGSACTTNDFCGDGECQGAPLDCDDNSVCTVDTCDATLGCQWEELEGACSDGDACTAGDTCVDGECVFSGELQCDDQSPCTTDVCDSDTGCVYSIIDGPCDDADVCTLGDTCVAGSCKGDLLVCDDGNVCTGPDYCDSDTGCLYPINALGCDDGDPCTMIDTCVAGICEPGEPNSLCCEDVSECDDGDLCTVDACGESFCSNTPITCDDGFPCTADACVEGDCVFTPYGPVFSGPIYSSGFEGVTGTPGGWAISSNNASVTWQIDTTKSHSGTTSMYCGNIPAYTYDFGATLASFTRIQSLPPGESQLSFWIYQELAESGSCSYDVTRVLVNGELQLPELCSSFKDWTEQTYDLTPWAGTEVVLEIRFDTGDGVANLGAGVWIDDVTVGADAPEGCCSEDAHCPDETLEDCEISVCGGMSFSCTTAFDDGLCDDGDPCTLDNCSWGTCQSVADPNCCADSGDCPQPDDGCSVATCDEGVCGVDSGACPPPTP